MIARGRSAAFVVLVGLAACGAGSQPKPGSPGGSPGTSPLTAQVNDATCRADVECRTVPVGARPCGGPERYVAWSTLRSDEGTVRAAARREAGSAAKSGPDGDNLLSTCQVLTDPGAYCERFSGDLAAAASGPTGAASEAAGTCRLRPSVLGAKPPIS